MLQVQAKRGGIIFGPPHNPDGTPGGGVPVVLKETQRIIEEEGFEINIPHEIRDLDGIYTFKGKNIEILDQILKLGGYSITDKVGTVVEPRDVVICVRSAWADEVNEYTGTIEEILHQINTSKGCKPLIRGDLTWNKNLAREGGSLPKGVKPREKDWQALDPYSPRWKKKKERLQELSNNIHRLRLNVSRDMQSDDERTALTALVVAVMDRSAERIGNDDSADNGHFGVTGFRKKHITVVGNKVHLEYVGKSGTRHDKNISDLRIAKALKKAIRNAPGKFIFETSDGFRIKSDRVNRYLEPFGISAKDLRGYNANKWIIEQLKSQKPQVSAEKPDKARKERKKIFNKAVKETAARVGHGAATLKKHYMVPELPYEYIDHGRIIDMKNIGYYKDGGPLGDLKIEDYFENKNEVPDAVNQAAEKIYQQSQDKGVDKFFNSQVVKEVEWKDVVPTQAFLRSSKFSRLNDLQDLYSINYPWAIEYNGKYYINDGHHRAVKMHERNLPIKLHVYPIEPTTMQTGSEVISSEQKGDPVIKKLLAENSKEILAMDFDDSENLYDEESGRAFYIKRIAQNQFIIEESGTLGKQYPNILVLYDQLMSQGGDVTPIVIPIVEDAALELLAEGGTVEKILYAVKKGDPDYMEQIITTKQNRIEDAKVWAKANGFDRFRVATIDLKEVPDFTKTITGRKDDGGSVEEKIAKRIQDRQKAKEFKDTGVATYTRKYHAAYEIITSTDLSDIEKDNVTAYKLIEKSKIWPAYNVNELKSQGNTSGAAYLKVKCREFLSPRPLDTKEAREVYVKNIEKLRSELEPIKTASDVKNYLYEFANLDAFDFGDISSFKSSYYISSSYKGNLAKYNEKQVEEYFDNIFGKKFYNFCRGKSDTAKKIFAEAFLYESYSQASRDAYVDKRYQILQGSLKRHTDLMEKIEASSGKEDDIKQLIRESGIPYYEYKYDKAHVINFLTRYITYLNTQTREKIESTLSGAYTVREDDWSWSDTDKEKKSATPKDKEEKIRKPQNIFEKYGIEVPKVLKRTPLDFVKRTGGLEVGDISTKAVLENFGFKNIIYGNYVNDAESKEHTKHILGAMLDMVEICNIDIKGINKLGGLDINIGATGCGPFSGAAACYFPSLKAINLTKKRGDGSLGHEWSHYLDNTLAQGAEKSATNIPYATLNPVQSERITTLFKEYNNWLMNGGTFRKIKVIYYPQKKFLYRIFGETLPAAIEAVQKRYASYKEYKNFNSNDLVRYYGYLAYKLNDNKPLEVELETRATQFYIGTSKYIPSDYFLNPKEMFARAFEGWLEYKLEKMGRVSNYLVDIKSGMGSLSMVIPQEEWCYPSGADVIWLDDWFERLFSAIRVDYGIKPFTWGTKERVDEYTDYKDTKNSKVDAGVEVKSDGTVVVEGDIEEFEKGYGFRIGNLKDAKGVNRNIYRLLTDPYDRGRGFATGGKQSDVFIFSLKYFTDQKSGYGISDGLTGELPNIVATFPDAKLEEAKKEAIEYFKSNKESKPKKPMTQESDNQIHLFAEGGGIDMPTTWAQIKSFLEGELPKKLPAEKEKISFSDIKGDRSFDTLNIQPIPYKIKKSDEPLKYIVSEDDLRPAMMAIHYDADRKEKVATDANVLVIIKDDSITATKNIDPNTGQEVKEKYPNYHLVIPENNPFKIFLPENQLLAFMDQLNGVARARRFLAWRSEKMLPAKITTDDIELYMNPSLLLKAINALWEYGARSINMEFSSPNRAVMLIDARNNGNKALVMPIMWDSSFISVPVMNNLPLPKVKSKSVDIAIATPKIPTPVKPVERKPEPKKDRKPQSSIHSCAVRLGRKGGLASAKARAKMADGGEITASDIKPGARFKNPDGSIFIIDRVYKDKTFGTAVESSLEGGEKGNYKDSIEEVIGFLNEEQVQKMHDGGAPCGCFHSFLAKEKPELVEQLEKEDVNSNPELRTKIDEAYMAWQGGSIN